MSFLPLDIDPQALKAMTNHAEAAFPNECCGFFYGSEDGQIRAVTVSTEVTNSKEGDQRRGDIVSQHGAIGRVAILRRGEGAEANPCRLVDEEQMGVLVPSVWIVIELPCASGIIRVCERAYLLAQHAKC